MKSNQPRADEVPFKEWVIDMADILRTSERAIRRRLERGSLKYPRCRRVNKRVIFVKI